MSATDDPDLIVSPDVRRPDRLPPNQAETRKWPVFTAGDTPTFDPAAWDFAVFPVPLVDRVVRFSYAEFMALPHVKVLGDMHCVTRWSKLDNVWEGVPTRELLKHVTPSPEAKYVMIHCDGGYTTNLPVEDFFREDCLFAHKHNGEDLEVDHGWPLRLVVPRLYAWKSAKWVRGVEFMAEDREGFWEQWRHGAYHMLGDPWKEQRHRPGSERPDFESSGL